MPPEVKLPVIVLPVMASMLWSAHPLDGRFPVQPSGDGHPTEGA